MATQGIFKVRVSYVYRFQEIQMQGHVKVDFSVGTQVSAVARGVTGTPLHLRDERSTDIRRHSVALCAGRRFGQNNEHSTEMSRWLTGGSEGVLFSLGRWLCVGWGLSVSGIRCEA